MTTIGRSEIDFDDLRSQVGHVVKLPRLPVDELPKGMEEEHLESFVLTEQRCQILERALKSGPGKPRRDMGFIPKGIQGSGKSVLVYAIACLAFTKQWPLVYVPNCSAWADPTKSKEEFIQYFIKTFQRYTPVAVQKSITVGVPNREETTVYQLLDDASIPITHKYSTLLDALNVHSQPVFVVLDEHNELLRSTEGRPWLRSWTRYDYGSALSWFTVLSGSSHSRFFTTINKPLDMWMITMKPFTKEETSALSNVLGIETQDATWLKRVHGATGGVPRSISKLAQFLQSEPTLQARQDSQDDTARLRRWVEGEARNYIQGYSEYFKALSPSAKLQLLQMFSAKGLPFSTLEGVLFDTGLFYENEDSLVHPCNEPAFIALIKIITRAL